MLNSMDRWKKFFAEGIRIANDKDYLSDLLVFEMNGEGEEKYQEMLDAFKEIFGEDLWKDNFPYGSEEEE